MSMHRLLLCTLALGCADKDENVVEVDCGEATDAAICTSWIMSEGTSAIIDAGTPTDVTGVVLEGEVWTIRSNGLPSYTVTLDAEEIAALNARGNAASDFATGQTTAEVGVTYDWGADIGYQSAQYGCADGAGFGWFPPGPACPAAAEKTLQLPASPTPAAADSVCELGLGAIGWWLNGVSVYNWSDGQTYNAEGQWRNVAQVLEIFDMGPCVGHAANGDYHHHTYSGCLAAAVGDDGAGHSPVYGYAADGYPIHGPRHDEDTLAQSCWMVRDYDDPDDLTGCGGGGERSCVMVDPMDPGAGTVAASAPGPSTAENVESLSGNVFAGSAALYYEDHYFSAPCAAAGGEHLDAHNGHDHDGIGYHYHITSSFPYMPGPTLYGEVIDDQVVCSGTSGGGAGGGPGGGPPDGGPPPM